VNVPVFTVTRIGRMSVPNDFERINRLIRVLQPDPRMLCRCCPPERPSTRMKKWPSHSIALLFALSTACSGPDGDVANRRAIFSIDSTFTLAGRPVPPSLINRYVAERLGFTSRGGEMLCAYIPLGVERDRVFVNTLCLELVRDGDSLAAGSGRAGPVALRVGADGDSVRVVSHEVPADGGGHAESIRRIFPPGVVRRIFAPTQLHNAGVAALESHLRRQAAARLGVRP
jgi:hypothetical protein